MFSRKKKKKEKPLLSCPFCGNAFEDVTDHISQCVGVNKNTSPKQSSSAVQPPSDSQPQPQPVPVVPTKEPAPVPAPANPLNTSPQKQVSPPVIEAKVEAIVAVAPQVQEPVAPVMPAKFESENKESEASKNTTDLNSDEDEEDSGETPDFPVGVVLFDHEQGSEVEISVTEGQHVFILDSSDSDWIYIGFDGKEGFIPANYLEPVKDKPNTPSEKTASLIKSENLQNLSTSAPGVINRSAVPVKADNSLAASSMDTAPAEKQPEMLKSRVKQVAANSAPGRANSTPTATFPPIENSESSVPSQRSLVPPKKVKSSKIGSFSSIGSTLRSRKKKKPAEFTIARADTQVTPITSQTPPGSPMESHSREIETDGPVEPAPTPVVASAPPEPAAPPPVPVDQRTNIAKEILSTELHYLNIIESLVNRYKDTLIRRLDLYSNSISKEQIVDIFGNLDMIIPINKQLCEDLRKVLESWNSTSTIGDIFVHVAPFLKMYNQYSNHYDQALNTLIKCMKNEDFSELVEEIDRTSKLGARLDSLLIAPIQRIPRYNLLLQELRKSTPHAHEDIEFLDKAIPLMQQVANYINSNMSAVENQEKLLSLSLAGAQSLLKPHRILLHEGIVTRDGKKKLHVWLFNDIIVLLPDNMAKNKEHLNRPEYQWPLHLVWLGSYLVKNKKESMFSLVGPTTAYSILCLNEEVQDWTSKIENAIRGHLEYLSRTQDVELTEEKKANMSYDNPKRYGSFTFPNGAEYSGWWNNGEFDGAGTFSFFNSTYVGTFVKGQRQGQGVLNYVTGEVYEGEWANDKQNGQGVLTYPNGDVYDGHWLDGMKHGKGSLVCTLGDSYMGEWAKDMPQGLGEMCYRSGKLYNGNWENGMQHHYGILICPDGEKYEGDWIAGVRHGKGRMEYFTDCYYDGYWSHGCKHGKGTFVSPEGTYEGEWVMDMKEGTGTMTYRDGKVYKGLWKKNFYHGQGTLTHPSGFIECYIGEWQNQKRHGSGILRMFNGDMYEGHFKDNKFHGTGSYSFGNGNTIKCKWSKGCITGECTFTMPPKVTDTHKDQYTYIGTYKDGKLTAPDRPPIHIRTIPAGEIDLM